MKKTLITLFVLAFLAVLFIMLGPFFVVDEREQVVVTRFGQIVASHTDAGLHFKLPIIDEVVTYPKMIFSLDGDPQSMPTNENK